MQFTLSDLFKAIGPTASIIFAAWIFMGFLQQRYDAAVERYREMIGKYRDVKQTDDRRGNAKDQIMRYKRRCELMNYACITGLVSAIMLLLTLIVGALDVILPGYAVLKYVGAGTSLLGFALVIAAAFLVIKESVISFRQLSEELLDVPELAHGTGQQPGSVSSK
jgi:uncharacterized membrane protein YraQ (UPF0718 family)